MNPTLALLRREWLQHRFPWLLMATVPTVLMLLLAGFGQVQFGDADLVGDRKAGALALAGLFAPTGLHGVVFWLAALILMVGLARRDHADRSVEFWLSLPVGHARSLAVPLAVHMIAVPIAGLVVGLFSGLLISAVLVARGVGGDAVASLPWAGMVVGALGLVARLALGVVLATLWLSPLILGLVALGAWFGRWGLVIGAVGLGLGSGLMDRLFGQPWLWLAFQSLFERAGRSVINSGSQSFEIEEPQTVAGVLQLLSDFLVADAGQALGLLASPALIGVLVVSAGLFALLVNWRRRGAGV